MNHLQRSTAHPSKDNVSLRADFFGGNAPSSAKHLPKLTRKALEESRNCYFFGQLFRCEALDRPNRARPPGGGLDTFQFREYAVPLDPTDIENALFQPCL